MAHTSALGRFEENKKDVDWLLEIHQDLAGNAPGAQVGCGGSE